jgi:hypothetical protein
MVELLDSPESYPRAASYEQLSHIRCRFVLCLPLDVSMPQICQVF